MADIEWNKVLMNGAVAVGGGFLLKSWLGGIAAVQNIIGFIPADLMGIDVQVLVFGIAALAAMSFFNK